MLLALSLATIKVLLKRPIDHLGACSILAEDEFFKSLLQRQVQSNAERFIGFGNFPVGHDGRHVLNVTPHCNKSYACNTPSFVLRWCYSGPDGSREFGQVPQSFNAGYIMQNGSTVSRRVFLAASLATATAAVSVPIVNASTPELTRALTYSGRHDQLHRPEGGVAVSLWLVCGWHNRLKREVPLGYVVTTERSRRLPGVMLAQPRPIGVVAHTDLASLRQAQAIAAANDAPLVSVDEMERRHALGMLLYPVRHNGERIKMSKQMFPAAIFRRFGNGMLFNSLTRAEVDHMLAEKKSGAPEPSHAAHLGGQGSEAKGITTAA
jgi:hypothetical protein